MNDLTKAYLKTQTRTQRVQNYLKTPLRKMLDEQIPRLSEQEAQKRKEWITDAIKMRQKYGKPPVSELEKIIGDWEQMRPRMFERLVKQDRLVATAEVLYHPMAARMEALEKAWAEDKIPEYEEYLNEKAEIERMALQYPEYETDEEEMQSEGSES